MRRLPMLALALFVGACAWNQMDGPPRDALSTAHPAKVRVTTLDGRETVIHSPLIREDSLLGAGGFALPLDSVKRLETHGPNGGLIALNILGAGVGVGLFFLTR